MKMLRTNRKWSWSGKHSLTHSLTLTNNATCFMHTSYF